MLHFFYGTLMKGMKWNGLLRPSTSTSKYIEPATTLGKLYLLDPESAVPALVDSTNILDEVHGELWELTDPYLIKRIYHFELDAGYYRVKRKTVTKAWEQRQAYTYLYPKERLGDKALVIPDGDYFTYVTTGENHNG